MIGMGHCDVVMSMKNVIESGGKNERLTDCHVT